MQVTRKPLGDPLVLLAPLETPEGHGLWAVLVLAERLHPVVIHTVRRLRASCPREVIVVVGQDREEGWPRCWMQGPTSA